ncbi:MAG: DUF4381 family protein [Rickettsiales bacterium]|jgi:hypothetical protein|nr:DUF4381 family protein [Rickettsiales bacterium]
MQNNELEKIISDIYDLKAISILPLSEIMLGILLALSALIITSLIWRKNYLKNRPWLAELKQIKNELRYKTSIELNELSCYLKKIANLKYKHNSLNKMEFAHLVKFLCLSEQNSDFHTVLNNYADKIYTKQNITIEGLEYNKILRLITKWI